MKVVHLTAEDCGGAGRAAIRISEALIENGIDSNLLVLEKYTKCANVNEYFSKIYKKFFFKLFRKLIRIIAKKQYRSDNIYFLSFGLNLKKHKEVKKADIVHIHWVANNYISKSGLEWLVKNKKVVCTLHDMWLFTGGCFYDGECGGYMDGCRNCPLIKKKKAILIEKMFDVKKSLFSKKKVVAVGCSQWIKDEAEKSLVFQGTECKTIPNPINLSIFKKYEKEERRKQIGISSGKKIIAFGAFSATADKRKGFTWLVEALKKLEPLQYKAVVFGNEQEFKLNLELEMVFLGIIRDDIMLAKILSAVDVFVAPSIQENLANTVMESLACGTPVVAFNIGGMPDLIQHKRTGYLAKRKDAEDLAEGIKFCCNHIDLGENAQEYVKKNFSYKAIGEKYKEIYLKMMEEG